VDAVPAPAHSSFSSFSFSLLGGGGELGGKIGKSVGCNDGPLGAADGDGSKRRLLSYLVLAGMQAEQERG
jgi:hypothetical protein